MMDFSQMGDLLGKAQEYQQKMKDDLAKMAIDGSSAGDQVQVTINGNREVTQIKIDPAVMSSAEDLADLMLAALNSAYAKVEDEVGQKVGNFGGLDLSSLANMFKL